MSYYRSASAEDSELVLKVWIGSIALLVSGYTYMIWNGIFDELWHVVFSNMTMWIVIAGLSGFGVWWWKKHENFSRGELYFFLGITPIFAFLGTAFGYFFFTDLGDREVWNGEATRVEYTERYCKRHTDSKGRVSYSHHGPYYNIFTNNPKESTGMASADWEAYVTRWGGKPRVTSRRNSSADDLFPKYIYTIDWDKNEETRVATAIEHPFVNYLRASDSILKTQGTMSGYEKWLKPYPRVFNGTYGPIEMNRVVCANVTLQGEFVTCLDRTLDKALREVGKQKEVNILVYVAGAADQGFFYALEDFWDMGKDNDVVVVIGTAADMNTIAWCQIMSWTINTGFKESLADRIRGLSTLESNGTALADIIVDQVCAPGADGFVRRPLSDFESLASEVRLPIWAHILVLLGLCLFMMPTVWLCIHD